MGQETHPRHRSVKSVVNLDSILGTNGYIFPKTLANERDPDTGESAIFVQTGGKKFYIICEKAVQIDYLAYCVLKDCGFHPEKYEVNGESDPLYEN